MPNVVALTEERAKADIEKLGLIVEVENRDLTSTDKFFDKGYVIAQDPDANSADKVTEGSTIKIYVSTGVVNYSYSPVVEIRNDFSNYESTGYVSIWSNGKMVDESGKLDFNTISSFTFDKIEDTVKEHTFDVKVRFGTDENYYTYAIIKVDASKDSTVEISKKTDYYKYSSKNQNSSSSETSSAQSSVNEKTNSSSESAVSSTSEKTGD